MDELGFKMDDPNFLAGVFYTINFISKRQDLELNPMEIVMEMAAESVVKQQNVKTEDPDNNLPQSSQNNEETDFFEDLFNPFKSYQSDEEDEQGEGDTGQNSGNGLVKWGATKEDMANQLLENGINVDPDLIVHLNRTEFMNLRNTNGYNDAQKALLSEIRRILRLRVNEAKRRHDRKAAKEREESPSIDLEKEDQDEDIVAKIGDHKPLTKNDMQKIISKAGLSLSIDKLYNMTGWEFRKFKASCNEEQALILGKFKRRLSAQKYAKRKKSIENGELPEKRSKTEEDTQAGPSETAEPDLEPDPIDIENRKLTNEEMQDVLTRAGLTITVDQLSEMDKKEYQILKSGMAENQASILGKIRNRLIMRNWWKKKKINKKCSTNQEINFADINPSALLELFSSIAQAQNGGMKIELEESLDDPENNTKPEALKTEPKEEDFEF